jgi:hypothetical protein
MLIVLIMLSILYGTSSTKFHLNKLSNNLTHDKSNFATKDMDYSVTSLLLTLQAGINHDSYDMGGGNNEDTEVGIQINLMEEIANIASNISDEEQREIRETQRSITEWKLQHCIKLQEEHRPEEFPIELWKWVADSEKPLVKERFRPLRTLPSMADCINEDGEVLDLRDNPNLWKKTRLVELIDEVFKIKISTESVSRTMEADIFRAQALANIDRWGHPDPNSPVKVENKTFTIRLKNPGDEPCYTKPRHPSQSEYWSLHWRTEYMLRRKEIGHSQSP